MKLKTYLLILFSVIMANATAQSVVKGNGWSARKVDGTYIVSIQDKNSITNALTDFVKSQQITAGQVTGIGAVNKAMLRFFNPETKHYVDKQFNEQMEITNLSGNVSLVSGQPVVHLHITLGKSDYTALAGHLLDADIRGAGEFFVYPLNTKAIKVKDENVGLNFYDFNE